MPSPSSSVSIVDEVNVELHAGSLHAALVVFDVVRRIEDDAGLHAGSLRADVFGVVEVKVAPWLHGGSLRAPTPPSWTPSTGVEMSGCTRASDTTVFS
jgi:hypothetical protein